MSDTYEYGPVFRERICALTLIPDWFARYGTVILPEYFETEEERKFIKFTKNHYENYQTTPEYDEAKVHFSKDPSISTFLDEVFDLAETGKLKFAEHEVITFAKQQAMKLAILKSVDDLEKGDLAKPLSRVSDAQLVGKDMTDLGLDLEKPDDWLYFDPAGDIPTGIQHLDEQFGGLSRGEYGIVITSTGVGKTMTLVNFGCGAASITARCNVTHVTLEMSAKKIMMRYAARITGRFFTSKDDKKEYMSDFERFCKMKIRGNIKVKGWPSGTATLTDIRSYLNMLEYTGYTTDLLIIDYPDLIRHDTNAGNLRQQLSHTAVGIRALAGERDIAIWGASQANRAAIDQELVDLANIAEDIGKASVADVIITGSQTKEEYNEGLIRYYAAKIREGPKNWVVRCKQDHKAHAITSIDVMTVSEMIEEKRQRKNDMKNDQDMKTRLKSLVSNNE